MKVYTEVNPLNDSGITIGKHYDVIKDCGVGLLKIESDDGFQLFIITDHSGGRCSHLDHEANWKIVE